MKIKYAVYKGSVGLYAKEYFDKIDPELFNDRGVLGWQRIKEEDLPIVVNGASSATGNCGASSATGYRGASSVSDPTGVAVAWGHEAKAKGCVGAHLILSDWRYIGEKWFDGDYKTPYDTESWELAGAKMVQVDGEKIKADIYYRCVDGEVVEAEE